MCNPPVIFNKLYPKRVHQIGVILSYLGKATKDDIFLQIFGFPLLQNGRCPDAVCFDNDFEALWSKLSLSNLITAKNMKFQAIFPRPKPQNLKNGTTKVYYVLFEGNMS